MKKVLLAFSVCALTACGGGGDSGGSFFGGVWRFSSVTTENNCELQIPEGTIDLTVNQADEEIAVQTPNGNNYAGTVTGEQSFVASRQFEHPCVPSGSARAIGTYRFMNIEGDMANVTFTREFSNCSSNTITDVSCRYVQEGKATRLN